MVKKESKLKKKLTKKFRLVILNEGTYEELFSLRLTRLNVFVLGGSFSILLIVLTFAIVILTPIKEYIPGVPSTQLKRQAVQNFYKLDSLQNQISVLENFTEGIKPILVGEDKIINIELPYKNTENTNTLEFILPTSKDSINKFEEKIKQEIEKKLIKIHEKELKILNKNILSKEVIIDSLRSQIASYQQKDSTEIKDEINFEQVSYVDEKLFIPSKKDSIFREKVEQKDKFSLFDFEIDKTEVVFFPPLKGIITEDYSVEEQHYAVDIAVSKGASVKSIADGTVIFSEWTVETGHVIIIEHINKYISVYKHNEVNYKKQGDFVKSGEVISIAGTSGEYSTGPHLHFEMWYQGYPVNPINFIEFK